MTLSTVIVVLAVLASAAHGQLPLPTEPPSPTCNIAWCGGWRAIAASGNIPGIYGNCVCTCKNMWVGKQCQTCPASATGAACDRCADKGKIYTPAYIPSIGCTNCPPAQVVPICLPCTILQHCNNHATAVWPSSSSTCACTCQNKWIDATPTNNNNGGKCATCPFPFGGTNCNKCANSKQQIYPICK